MLSLLEEWDYTLQGLACINWEQFDAICQAAHELDQSGLYRAGEGTRQPRTATEGGVHHLRIAASAISLTSVGKTDVGKSYVDKSDAIE